MEGTASNASMSILATCRSMLLGSTEISRVADQGFLVGSGTVFLKMSDPVFTCPVGSK